MSSKVTKNPELEKLVNFCKTRGFVYPSSEIYGGLSGIYDYGHYGFLLKENIKNAWIKSMIQDRDDIILLDTAIFMHPTTWHASGHVTNFNDPLVDCKDCKSRYRADYLLKEYGIELDDKTSEQDFNKHIISLKQQGILKCPNCSSTNLTEARKFSLMVKSNLGFTIEQLEEDQTVYLRPETCGGIYLQYKNVVETLHPRFPFGIAQVGKAFRNEIIARQFIYRTREFEQMEMQYFHHPSDTLRKYEEWKNFRWQWYLDYGISVNKLQWYKHEKLAHYATQAYDIQYKFKSLGGSFLEVEGIHTRGDWDLSQHSKYSNISLEYYDQSRNQKFIPHILETSAGLNRLFLMFIDNAYEEEVLDSEAKNTRIILKLDKRLAPVKLAVLPLLRKPLLVQKAKEIYYSLKKIYIVEYDETGSIGKRYRRQDEIGTPYCLTVDFQTLQDNTITVRERDSMRQIRIKIDEITNYLRENL